VSLLTFHVSGDPESLVFEPFQRPVDRGGRGRVTTVQLLLQLLHHLVAVAGLVLEQLEDDVLHVPRSEPLPAAAPGTPPEKATGTEAQRERIPSEMPSHGLPPVLHRYTMFCEDIMVRLIC